MDVVIPVFVFVPLGTLAILVSTRSLPADERAWLTRLLFIGFALRVAVASTFALFPSLRIFHEDTEFYEKVGILLASSWRGEYPPFPSPNGFTWLSAAIYYVFGRFRVNLPLFNAVIGTLLIGLIYTLTKKLFHLLIAKRAALLIALLPSMILWGSMALKDILVTFLIAVALTSCISLKEKTTVSAALGILLPLAAIQPLRFYNVYFVGLSVAVALILDKGGRLLTGVYKQIFLVAAGVALFVLLGNAGKAQQDLDYFSLEFVSSYRYNMATTARSGFDANIDISTPGAALAYLPIGMSYMLLGPFPWQWTSLRPLIAAPETIFWWTLFPATIRGMVFAIRKSFSLTSPLLLFSVTLTCGYSLIHGNVGSAFRQRAQILVFLFIFSALGTYLKKCRAAGLDELNLLKTPPAPSPPEAARTPAGIAPRPVS
jgi:4-amino-4-deoxy-L-arabinose transferase-like glycosyltransferase